MSLVIVFIIAPVLTPSSWVCLSLLSRPTLEPSLLFYPSYCVDTLLFCLSIVYALIVLVYRLDPLLFSSTYCLCTLIVLS